MGKPSIVNQTPREQQVEGTNERTATFHRLSCRQRKLRSPVVACPQRTTIPGVGVVKTKRIRYKAYVHVAVELDVAKRQHSRCAEELWARLIRNTRGHLTKLRRPIYSTAEVETSPRPREAQRKGRVPKYARNKEASSSNHRAPRGRREGAHPAVVPDVADAVYGPHGGLGPGNGTHTEAGRL